MRPDQIKFLEDFRENPTEEKAQVLLSLRNNILRDLRRIERQLKKEDISQLDRGSLTLEHANKVLDLINIDLSQGF